MKNEAVERFAERYSTYTAGRAHGDLVACGQMAVGYLLASGLPAGAAALALLLDKEFPDNGSPWRGMRE